LQDDAGKMIKELLNHPGVVLLEIPPIQMRRDDVIFVARSDQQWCMRF
jgi:hypothetical protein